MLSLILSSKRCSAGRAASFFYLILLICFSKPVFSIQSDSLKYPLNDPRNPKCPCHKYQEKANKEFKRISSVKTESFSKKDKNKNVLSVTVKEKQKYYTRLKRKKRQARIKPGNRKNRKISLFARDRISDCPH